MSKKKPNNNSKKLETYFRKLIFVWYIAIAIALIFPKTGQQVNKKPA